MAGRSARFGAAAVFVALGALGVVCAVTQPTSTTRSSQSAGAGDSSSSSPGGGGVDNGGGSSDTTGTVAPGSSASPGAKPNASSSAKSTGGKKTTGGSGSTSGDGSVSVDTGQPLYINGSPNPDISVGPPNYTIDPSTGTSPNPGGGTTPNPAPSSTPACPPPPSVSNPIPLVQMSTTLAADGSAAHPQTTFQASTTQKIIAVATLNNLPCGTRINYVWIHGTTYDPSQTFTLKTSLKHFYIQFAAPAGGSLTTGQFRIRYYVNEQVAYDISYQVV